MIERELTGAVPLVGPDGRLNRDAVGWARHPIIDTSAIGGRYGWGRNKRWEYWSIATPRHVVGLTVSSLDYAAVHEVWVLDRETGRQVRVAETVLPARGVTLSSSLGDGPARARTARLSIDFEEERGGTRVRAEAAGAAVDVFAARPAGHECLAVVVPWSDRRFQYTVKDVARPASGSITVDGATYEVPAGESWAVLDHGRGRWPYDVAWNWGAGSGTSHGRTIGLQVGGQWTDGTGSTENAMLIDGRLHKISADLAWDYDLSDWRRPWRVSGGGLEAQLAPFHNKRSSTRLGIVSSRTDQCFGWWSGSFATAEGERVDFAEILGFAEDVHNRW